MAYDPEARKQSNSALTIGLIALAVLGLSALAYFATRPAATPETSPVIVNSRKETVVVQSTPVPSTNTTIVVQATPVPAAPDTVIVTPPVSSSTTTTTTTQGAAPQNAAPRNSQPSSGAPVASPPAEQPKTTVNNTIINPPMPSGSGQAQPVKPDASAPGAAMSNAAPAADSNAAVGY